MGPEPVFRDNRIGIDTGASRYGRLTCLVVADGPPRVLLGDFNSTLDHRPLRALIARGYRDAAATLGEGLAPSWGPYGAKPIPPITIDHVLADRRLGVTGYATHALPNSDHHLVFAALTVPF